MKKLMILGGSRYALPVIKAAHGLGLHVITADYLPDNAAHKFSDEYCNVSIIDLNATLREAERRQIDGIISFACDPGVVTAAYVAEKLGLPSVGSYEAVSLLQNKGKFRKFLADHGFHVPKAKGYTNINEMMKDTDLYHWPVIVKPADSAGSKGVTKVNDPTGLKPAVEYALSFSHTAEFIIEEFIMADGFPSDSDCFSVDGELKFVSFNSQRFDANAKNPYVPAAFSWPSSMSEGHKKELASELQRLISLLGLKTSLYNVETRVGTDGKAYIMECSPRGGGNRLSECLEYATGVRLIENAVRAAVGMPTVGIVQKPCNGCWAEYVIHAERKGIFNGIVISGELEENVVEKDLWVNIGDLVHPFSAANDSLGTVILRFDDEIQMRERMDKIGNRIKIALV